MSSQPDSRSKRRAPRTSLVTRLRNRTRVWARRRHGIDSDPFVVPTRRVYIVPTRLGLFFSGMIFLMFMGSMNYANNLALGLTFILASVAMVAMHYCQRNLVGLRLSVAGNLPVFAGTNAHFNVGLDHLALKSRYDINLTADDATPTTINVHAGERVVATLAVPASQRGRLELNHVQVSGNYPFGLFRAWTHVHLAMSCIVYPKPAERAESPPLRETDTGGAQDSTRGDDDFAGLRAFHSGDSPRRIAWKAYARGQELQVKQYAGTAVTSHILDWDSLSNIGTEARLSRLCRWVEDAYAAGHAFGLRIPGTEIAPNIGPAHRHHCLTALALYGLDTPQ